ncbi:MAG TPA: hypothetical protein VHG93_17765 [Longimicrobium sp.]|nr:hypothetical protein [Longimicrobium sp.]
MSPELLDWLSKAGVGGILILALWLFKDRIYFSFGQPPEGIRFRHPADTIDGAPDDTPSSVPLPKRSGPGNSQRRSR